MEVSSDGVARTPRIRGEEGQVNKKSIEMTRKRQRERERVAVRDPTNGKRKKGLRLGN